MKLERWSNFTIDACGGFLSAALLAAATWSALFAKADGGESLSELEKLVATARADLGQLRSTLQDQKSLQARHQAELAAVGALPGTTPPETYLRAVSDLAAQNHLSVVRQLPLSARQYPGLIEQRFAYEVQGTMPDLARFFKDVEGAPSSTDISYLKIERHKDAHTADRTALLTFSVFFMAREDAPIPAGG